jgi:predicted RNA binding protein YcfA (HicA-like mRNA interferase family)
MPNGLMNWTFEKVTKFLKKHNFIYNYARGSHHFYIGSQGGISRQVSVPFHGKKAIKPRTMKSIILQSGISKEEWMR